MFATPRLVLLPTFPVIFIASVVCALILLSPRSFAQTALEDVHVSPRTPIIATETPAQPHRPLIRSNVDLVLVPVTVTDLSQRLVTGLGPENFEVFENKKPQQIKQFSSEDAPVSLGILVDSSGSMTHKMDRVREAVKQFCESANPQDEFFVITFSDTPSLVQDFTNSSQDVDSKMFFVTSRGRTALLDAVYMGLRKMKSARYSKKAILIISDGGDNHSRYTDRELKSAVKESDVIIYAVGIFERNSPTEEERLGPALLTDIAEITGGRAFTLENLVDLPVLTQRIGMELRTQYVLAYRPDNPPHDGKWHKITVKLKIPKKLPFMQAKARTGYYARSE